MNVRNRVRSIIFFLGFGVFLGVLSPLCVAEDVGSVPIDFPKLDIKKRVFEFGSVMQGTRVEHIFELMNNGAAPLTIDRIQPACGCTAAVPDINPIPPGKVGKINASFDTSGFQGYKVKTVRLFTNDPKQPSAVLTFKGTVKTEIEVDPPRLYFGVIPKGNSVSRRLTIAVHDEDKVTIKSIKARSDDIDLSLERSGPKNAVRAVSVTLKESMEVGVFRSRLVIKTSSKRNPVINVPVFARVEGDLKLVPSDVSFGLVNGPIDAAVSQKVRMVNSGEAAVHVLSIKSSNPAISATIDKVEAGKVYDLTIEVKPGTSGPFRGQLDIVTDHPDRAQSEIALPVYGIISRKGP